uniref:YGGT family domain protein, putative n=1 Tax=Babesia bovis TaxID=5865 RepID=S6BHH1_BABBO|nr:YGGT family domain protein, putative [Babesia bovis]
MKIVIFICVLIHTLYAAAISSKSYEWNKQLQYHKPYIYAKECSVAYRQTTNGRRQSLSTVVSPWSQPSSLEKTTSPNIELHRTFLNIWKNYSASILLSAVYSIRIFRFLLYIRNLLEWLPQANPYIFPFDAIYQATNAYIKPFQSMIPVLYGVDISTVIAFFILERLEYLLSHKPGVAQAAL